MYNADIINRVEKPCRYTGGEALSVIKDPAGVELSFALAFPEVYEIAMSHQGLKVLYDLLAPRQDIAAERVYCPWLDMMDAMHAAGEPLRSLESGRPLDQFDVVGFSLQYELTYTNILHMLRLGGVPARRQARDGSHPLVIAGGPCAVNPEPLADFLDLVAIGDGEELVPELCDLLIQAKRAGWPRDEIYRRASAIGGVYAPALFQPRYDGAGRLLEIEPLLPGHNKVRRRVLADLGAFDPPTAPVVPLVRPVHDRLGLEVSRGCTRGCRFCQAGYTYRPVRERPAQQALDCALQAQERTGLDELALLSLSTGDYTCIEPLATALMDALHARRVSLSLPSLRIDSLSRELIAQIKRVRKTGFTLAPEAGSQAMRERINKNLTQEQILDTAGRVFGLGWNLIKLYFMIGLPGETEDDVAAIGELCHQVAARAVGAGRGKRPVVNASVGIFVPKPHTPFQWEAQMGLEQSRERLAMARQGFLDRRVRFKWNEPKLSLLEGLLSRGDRRVGRVLEIAAGLGCRYDGWVEHADLELWQRAVDQAGLSFQEYLRARDPGEVLPWDHIDLGLERGFLLAERDKAAARQATADCRSGACQNCGVCDFKTIRPRLAEMAALEPPEPPAQPGEKHKYRFRLEKTGPARFLGHLEMMSQIERSLRRAGVELAHSEGFHPHALVKANSALPLGVESICEVLEVATSGPADPADVAARTNPVLPRGLFMDQGRPAVPGEKLAEPDRVVYEIKTHHELSQAKADAFKAADSWYFERKSPKGGRTLDFAGTLELLELRPGYLKIAVGRDGGRPKPAEVLQSVFGLDELQAQAARALKIDASWNED